MKAMYPFQKAILLVGIFVLCSTTFIYAQKYSKQEAANRKLVTAGFESWRNGTGSFFDLLAEDVQWEITGSTPYSKTYTSKKQLMDEVLTPLNKKLKVKIKPTVRHIYTDGDMVIALWDGEALALDDKPYRSSYSWYMRMQNGRITQVTAFLDGIEFADIMKRIQVD